MKCISSQIDAVSWHWHHMGCIMQFEAFMSTSIMLMMQHVTSPSLFLLILSYWPEVDSLLCLLSLLCLPRRHCYHSLRRCRFHILQEGPPDLPQEPRLPLDWLPPAVAAVAVDSELGAAVAGEQCCGTEQKLLLSWHRLWLC